ncbi:tetratricopeptide repeat protein [uncultured Microscilla sp.]|uniref:tetratricopeptide repeat protein n=1 Tax=uncultured Microscilla sp. TaxID=432653 RepID=UPI0026259B3F|nr:tetratricopeptide repeat protein [uncultured Microscilla sp.]
MFFLKLNSLSFIIIITIIVGCMSGRKGADAYFKSGNIKSYQGDYKGAVKDFGRALKVNPLHAKAYLGRSNVKYNLKNYRGAIEDCNTAIQLNPDLIDAYFNLGISYYELKKYKEAVSKLSTSIRRKPNDPEAYYIRGKAKMHLGDTLGACNDWQYAASMSYLRAAKIQKKYCTGFSKNAAMEEEAPAQVREIRDNR